MDLKSFDISSNNIKIKENSKNSTLKINQMYFSLEKIPYNKILYNLLIFLQRRLSSRVFNEIYKYFIKELKRYLSLSSYKNLTSNNFNNTHLKNKITNKNNFGMKRPLITDFCDNETEKNNKLIKTNQKPKKVKPLIGLSFSHKLNKLNSQKRINSSSFSNLNFNNLDINFLKKCSNIQNKKSFNNKNNALNKTINNSNSKEEKHIYYKNKIKIFLNNNDNKFKINEKLLENKIHLKNTNFNTINTTIHKNDKIKKINNNLVKKNKENKSQHISNVRKKINTNKTLGSIPHQTFIDLIDRNQNNKNLKSTTNNNIKNTVVINNTIFNKFKNNINIGLIEDDKKRLKIINIKLQKPKNKGDKELLKPLETSEEMLKKIKNSLDDEYLKGMLNFSYENFLSKESERESKEYNIED